jgi:hypothetical protein
MTNNRRRDSVYAMEESSNGRGAHRGVFAGDGRDARRVRRLVLVGIGAQASFWTAEVRAMEKCAVARRGVFWRHDEDVDVQRRPIRCRGWRGREDERIQVATST